MLAVKRQGSEIMLNCLITMRSETYSQKAGKLFRDNGVENGIVKLGREYTQKGCGHGIKIDCRARQFALRLLKENGIPYSDVSQL